MFAAERLSLAKASFLSLAPPKLFIAMFFFVLKKPLFAPELSPITDKLTASAYDPMAGNNNRDWVGLVGGADSSAGLFPANPTGDFLVRNSLAIGNFKQLLPDQNLKICSLVNQREGKSLPLSGEIFSQLALHLQEEFMVNRMGGRRGLSDKIQAGQSFIGASDFKRPEGGKKDASIKFSRTAVF